MKNSPDPEPEVKNVRGHVTDIRVVLTAKLGRLATGAVLAA